MRLLAIVGLATGMRRGEILAVRWKCVNLETGRVQVEQSLEQTKAGGLAGAELGRCSVLVPAHHLTPAITREISKLPS
jgi:integrase